MNKLNKKLTSKSYPALLKLIRQEIQSGTERIQKFVDYQKIVTNWNVGKHISTHLLQDKIRAKRGDQLFLKLAQDLGIHERFLNLTVQFYRTYSTLPENSFLNWSHYRILVTIPDLKKRTQLEERIIRERLTTERLRALKYQMFKAKEKEVHFSSGILPEQRGQLYLYRVIKKDYLRKKGGSVMVDCGFDICVPPPLTSKTIFHGGALVESWRDAGRYYLKHVSADRKRLYTYVAVVQRVVDGDTLVLNIDCGFGVWLEQRVRLKGIDTPEMTTIKGKQAKQYVEQALLKSKFVVIKSYGWGKFGRAVVGVFYLPKEKDARVVAAKGKFLNQELINVGLAKKV
ncbi:MAG: thermonuclease family protein [Candidatus Omnitrophica bacterium]|nr:thermonuclease family protein [Candidatus Omnitrophota bacterium]